MKLKSLINISETYFRHKNSFRLQVFTVFSLMFFLLFFIISFSSTFHSTIKKIFSSDSNTFITIAPKETDIGVFKFNTPSFFGKGDLGDKDLGFFNSLEGVTEASPTYSLDAPAHMSGQLFDFGYGTDLSIFGEDRPFKGLWYSKKNTDNIRSIASSKLLDIYNSSFAPANDLPKMTEKILVGRRFDLKIGESTISSGTGKSHKMKVTVIGTDKDVPFLGLTIPEVTLRQVAEKIGAQVTLANIKVYFKTSADMIKGSDIIENKGYRILENENDIFRTINRYISMLDYFLFLPIAFILLVIVLFVQNQIRYMLLYLRREIGIQMAIGAYENDIIIIWLFQYAKYIFYGLIAGAGTAFVLIKLFILANENTVISRMVRTEFSFTTFSLTSAFLITGGIFYIYFKIRNFLKTGSIISLMSSD